MFDLPVPGLESIAEVNCDMNKILATVSLLLVLALAALAADRMVVARGTATDMDQGSANAEARKAATENFQNACPKGAIPASQVTNNECHSLGIGSFTCTVEITGNCQE
jgi:hypothetical protein